MNLDWLLGTVPLEAVQIWILIGTSVATAALSAIVGMAGGITLLAVMLLFLDPLTAIPIHGAIQLISNSSRTFVHRRHFRRDVAFAYAIPLLPAAFAGLWLAQALPPDATKATIGLFVLAATWRPRWLLFGMQPQHVTPGRRFFLLGSVAGFLNVTIGATGPLIAPFFPDMGFDRFALIGTKAACQTLGHLSKIVVFGVAGFAFLDWGPLLAAMGAGVVAGTWLGTLLLARTDERVFQMLYRGVLTIIAIRLVLLSIPALV